MSLHDEMGGGSNVKFDVDDGFIVERESCKDGVCQPLDLETRHVTKKVAKEFNFRAKDTQVGGSHYKNMAIQPFEYAMKNNLNAGQFGVLKYITRYKLKNGIEDLRKAKHFLELLAEEEYGEKL